MPAAVSRGAAQSLLRSQHPYPFQLNDEYGVDEVISNAQTPADAIRAIAPPVPQMLMPPKFGYYDVPLTIEDVLATDRWAPKYRSWVSGARTVPPPPIDPNGLSGTDGGFTKNSLVGGRYGL